MSARVPARTPWRRALALVVLGWVALLAAGELAVRRRWTAPWYERLVDAQAAAGKPPYAKNRWQLRDRDHEVPRPPGLRRVLVMGASCVMGSGVREDELVFPELLERDLNRLDWPGAPGGVEVLNAGMPGSFPKNWLWMWKRFGDEFDPDLLLIVCFLRDGTRTGTEAGFFDPVRDELAARDRDSWLYAKSYLFRLLRDRLDQRLIARRMTQAFHRGYFGDEDETRTWRESRDHLRELAQVARGRGTRVALAVPPILVETHDLLPFVERELRAAHQSR